MKWFGMWPSDPSHHRPRSKGGLRTRAKEEKREENDVGKARSLPQEWSTWKVLYSGWHLEGYRLLRLQRHLISDEGKSCGLYYKCFTIVIFNHNDSGQYYKTTITIIIDDAS